MTIDAADGGQETTVAIVDDEPSVRVSLRRLCNALGMCATAYASGRAFLDALESGEARPDCLLLDIQMPGMTGFEVQRHLVARDVRIPTIIVTADDAPEARARCAAAGAVETLRKPIGADELIAAIERAVRPRLSDPSFGDSAIATRRQR
ncbi:MAG: response regulator transcription factor [Gemmatimonadaceae bacterium]